MSNFVRVIGSLFAFVFGIILLPICFVVGLLFSLYFTYELVALYFTTIGDTYRNNKNTQSENSVEDKNEDLV